MDKRLEVTLKKRIDTISNNDKSKPIVIECLKIFISDLMDTFEGGDENWINKRTILEKSGYCLDDLK